MTTPTDNDQSSTPSTFEPTGPLADIGAGAADRPEIWRSVPLALRRWNTRQWAAAALGTVSVGAMMGLSTVLIPNRVFGRQIAALTWNYPVWMIISVLSGMLVATYVAPTGGAVTNVDSGSDGDSFVDPTNSRSSRLGAAGTVLGWFAVGCPVCNKIALIALGYTGAIRWFAPVQPYLAVLAIGLSAFALASRLRGQIWCPLPAVSARPSPIGIVRQTEDDRSDPAR